MTALAPSPTLFDNLGAGPTLDDLIAGAWEGLSAHQSVDCLACGEPMTPEYGAHALPIGGHCRHCGTTLS
jgi:hypothetical protein